MQAVEEKFLKMAIELANKNVSSLSGGPFGAVIVKDGQVLSSASNKVTLNNDPTAHAEVEAIREACKKLNTFNLEGCVLYCSCEPCPMCLGAVYWARLESVVYASSRHQAAKAGFDDSLIYDEIPKPAEQRIVKMVHVDLPEAEQVFEDWRNNAGKIAY